MSNIIVFQPKAELTAHANLTNFIAMARDQLQCWQEDERFDWDKSCWSTHHSGIRFISLESTKSLARASQPSAKHLLSAPFLDFAKAYIRYDQALHRTKSLGNKMTALRLVEASLIELEGCSEITRVTARHLDHCTAMMKKREMKALTEVGAELVKIARRLVEWHLCTANLRSWRHPFKTVRASHAKFARKSKEEREKRLPSEEALLAIAEIFANGYTNEQDDETIFITCVVCILLCAPIRISDLCYFRKDVLREEVDSKGQKQYYFAYYVPKNNKYVRKEIPKVMAELAREAVRRLIRITEEPRKLALHFEKNPDKFYRHQYCPNVTDDSVLSMVQVTKALGQKNFMSARQFIKRLTGSSGLKGWTLKTLWQAVILKDHDKRFRFFPHQIKIDVSDSGKPPKMSESLFCFRWHQLSTNKQECPVLLTKMKRGLFAVRVSSSQRASFFGKNGYEGLYIDSHSLRRLLNTLAYEGGVDVDAITEWSTRASNAQTRTYIYQDPDRQARKSAETLGIPVKTKLSPITEDEYELHKHGPIIVTQYGICSHDYTLTPCNKHADCLECSELLLCKGHKRSIEAIQNERNKTAQQLEAVDKDIKSGKRAAGRWYEAHSKKLARMDQLLEVMNDPNIKDGSPIQQIGKDFSHESRIIAKQTGSTSDCVGKFHRFTPLG